MHTEKPWGMQTTVAMSSVDHPELHNILLSMTPWQHSSFLHCVSTKFNEWVSCSPGDSMRAGGVVQNVSCYHDNLKLLYV